MEGFLKFLGGVFGGGGNPNALDLNKILGRAKEVWRPDYAARFPCQPGAFYQVGDRIGGHYEVVGMLGRGGFGVVHLVRRISDGELCALKTFRDEFLTSSAAREAFKRELSVWVGLGKHPNILEAVKVFEYSGRLFVEMQSVLGWEGRISLKDHLRQSNGPLDTNQSLEWAIQFCFGMEHARFCGVKCHRDIKPENILITREGELKIGDFGLAAGAAQGRRAQGAGVGSFVSGAKEGEFGLSLVQIEGKQVCGTPGYIAPEVYRGEQGDEQSDVYSFGLVLAQMAGGNLAPPFAVQNCGGIEDFLQAIYRQQMSGPLPRVNGPLRPVIGRCLQPTPSERYGSFRDLRSDLQEVLCGRVGTTVPMPRPNAQDVDSWRNKGRSLYALGQVDEAIACYDKVLALEPLSAVNWYNKGAALCELGRHKEAWGCFEESLRLDASFAQAWSGKGDCYARSSQHIEAIQCYDKALAINPKDFAVWSNRGLRLSRLGRRDEAIASFDRALTLDPRNAIAWFNKGTVLHHLHRDREALGCLDAALAIDPRFAGAWLWKGKVEEALGRLREARHSYRNYLAVALPRSADISFVQQRLHELG